VRASRDHIPLNLKPRKHIPTIIKTLGDYIQTRRYEKGLHPYEIAKKMGIASSLVLAWERDESQPDDAQWRMLGRLLAFDAG